MSFTDGKPRVATEEEVDASWGGMKHGKRFRCYLCGYKFQVGDTWRWVYANGHSPAYGNFMVCDKCDGLDVLDKWNKANEEARQKFWWIWELT